MKSLKCPLCGTENDNSKILYKIQKTIESGNCFTINVICCKTCSHHFSKFTDHINIEKLYSGGNYELLDTRGSLFDKIMTFDDNLVLRQLSHFRGSGNKLLDFGCGKGRFIHNAAKHGWKVFGVETAKARAEFGKKLYKLDINTLEYNGGRVKGGPFNAITIFHVLEHLSNPKDLLDKLLHNNLAKDGYAVIEVPSFKSLQSKMAGKYWLHLDPPLHISHFSESSLLNLLNELNIRPIRISYLSLNSGMLGMVQSLMALLGYRKNIIAELKFRRTKRLMLAVCSLLPAAIILECAAILFKKGGVLRVYCKLKSGLD